MRRYRIDKKPDPWGILEWIIIGAIVLLLVAMVRR
jgi:hypothetical protein